MVKLLLERGARVDREAVKSGCRTALHFAAGRGMVDTMAVLLSAGADPNHERDNGETVLLRAAREGKTPVVQALLQHPGSCSLARGLGRQHKHAW